MRHRILMALLSVIMTIIALIGMPMTSRASSNIPQAINTGTASLPPAYQQFLASAGGSHFITVDDVKMHYVEAGSRNQPTLLLLHGSPDNIFTWRTIMPLLAHHYHVIAPDLIGFGLSAHPDIHYTWSAETDYLTDLSLQSICDMLPWWLLI